jgi:hypothetical protein
MVRRRWAPGAGAVGLRLAVLCRRGRRRSPHSEAGPRCCSTPATTTRAARTSTGTSSSEPAAWRRSSGSLSAGSRWSSTTVLLPGTGGTSNDDITAAGLAEPPVRRKAHDLPAIPRRRRAPEVRRERPQPAIAVGCLRSGGAGPPRYRAHRSLDCAGSRAVATGPYSTGLAARSDLMSGPRRAAGSGQLAGDRRRGRTERRIGVR